MKKLILIYIFLLSALLSAQTPFYLLQDNQKGSAVGHDGSSKYSYVTPALRLTGKYSLRDDFSVDGMTGVTNRGWVVSSGTYTVNNLVDNPLSANDYALVCQTAGVISIPCNQAYGKWSFDLYKGADANDSRIHFISDIAALATTNGYRFLYNNAEDIYLTKFVNGGATHIMRSAVSYIQNTTWYHIDIYRNTNGSFSVYLNNVLVSTTGGSGSNPVVDNTYSSSNYFVIDADANDRISNISCEYGEGSLDLNSFERTFHSNSRDFENVLGTELVTNGDCSSATGWTLDGVVSGGVNTLTADGTSQAIFNTFASPVVTGSTYKFTYTVISNTLVGTGALTVGGFTSNSIYGSGGMSLNKTVGVHTYYFVSNAANGKNILDLWIASTHTSGAIVFDNISIQQVSPTLGWTTSGNYSYNVTNADKHGGTYSIAFTTTQSDGTTNYASLPSSNFVSLVSGEKYTLEYWARGTGVLGSELVTNGTFDSDTWWSKKTGTTIGSGVATITALGAISGSAVNWSLNKSDFFIAGKTYKVSFKAKQTSGTGNFQSGQAYTKYIDQQITSEYVTYTYIFVATAGDGTSRSIVFGGFTNGDTFEIDDVSVKEVTLPSLTLNIGSQSKTFTNISCVPNTWTKCVFNFQATSNEVGQMIKMYANQADQVYLDDFSLTRFYPTSISGWFKTNVAGSDKMIVAKQTGITSAFYGYHIRVNTDNLVRFFLNDGATANGINSPQAVNDNLWHYFTAVIDYNGLSLFVDNQSATGVLTFGNTNNAQSYTVGRSSSGATWFYSGSLGELQHLKEYVKTQAEHLAEWKNGMRKYDQEMLRVKWSGTGSDMFKDYSKYGNNLTGVNINQADQVKGNYPSR